LSNVLYCIVLYRDPLGGLDAGVFYHIYNRRLAVQTKTFPVELLLRRRATSRWAMS